MLNFGKTQSFTVQLVLIGLVILNVLWWQSAAVGLIIGSFYLLYNSKKLGDLLFADAKARFKNTLALLIIFCYLSLIYTLAYHFYEINLGVWLFVLISIPALTEIFSWKLEKHHYFFEEIDIPNLRLINIRNFLFPLVIMMSQFLTFVLLSRRATVNVLRSPWEVLDDKFWLLLIVSSICLIIYALQNQRANRTLFLIFIHFVLISSIALFIYPIGYGYDQFIHEATLRVIDQTGTITPRLFLYVGQYGLTFFFSKLFMISLPLANRLLLPFAFGLFWPSLLYYGLRAGYQWPKKISLICIFLSLFVGFNFAITNTPQNLAFLYFALYVFLLPLLRKNRINLYFGLALSLATITIHPLAGIPMLGFTFLLMIKNLSLAKIWRTILYYVFFASAAISLPLMFAIYQKLSGRQWSDILSVKLWPLIPWPKLSWQAQYAWPLDWLHNIWDNRIWLYVLIALVGLIFISWQERFVFIRRNISLLVLLAANYLLARIFISFDQQIVYEQTDYLMRILYLMSLLILPLFLTAFYFWWQPIAEQKSWHIGKVWMTVLTLLLLLTSVYFSYPIYDRYTNSKSFNVTQADLEAVRLIENSSDGQPYIVLANQMIGAAAIQAMGFAHYYPEGTKNIFYYSMPLGSSINTYENFLNMIEKDASREEALQAMDKAQVNKLYFVINNYWHSAKIARQQAAATADANFTIDNGRIEVFVYNR